MQIYYDKNEYESMQTLLDPTKLYLKRRRYVLCIHYGRYMMFRKYGDAA
ncbi:MAG TPA: hypothetical protein PKC91_03715 [Ignavibacteria bacterium]|nr:hypothetical protein [Ignavibacteria bacterium]